MIEKEQLVQIITPTPHQSDRVGRVGSANAAKIFQIGSRGFINSSDSELLGLIKGDVQSKEISTYYMNLGNELEDIIFECLKVKYPDAISNPYYESKEMTESYGFSVSNHIDYAVETKTHILHFENKAFKDMNGIQEVEDRAMTQLAWHYMLLQEQAKAKGKKFTLYLSYYDTTDYDGVFDPSKLEIKKVNPKGLASIINVFKLGLKIISKALPTFVYEPKNELVLSSESLPSSMQEQFHRMRQMEELLGNYAEEVKDFKSKMKDMMQEKGIKKIELEDLGFTITCVSDCVANSFSKSSFQKDHPELYRKYSKNAVRKGYAKIRFKDKDV